MPGPERTPSQMSKIIGRIYEEPFASKPRGRYKMTRSQFRILSRKHNLTDAFISEVAEELLRDYFFLIVDGDDIAFIESEVVSNYRPVPKRVVRECITEIEGDDTVESASNFTSDDDDLD